MRKFVKLLSLILALSMCVCVFTACGSKVDLDAPEEVVDPEEEAVTKVVNDFFEAMTSLNLDEALSYCGSEEMLYSVEIELSRTPDVWQDMKCNIQSITVDEDEAIVKVEVYYGNKSDKGKLRLSKYNDTWKIYDMSI